MKPFSIFQKEIRQAWAIPTGFVICFLLFLFVEILIDLFGKGGFLIPKLESFITGYCLCLAISFSLGAFFLSSENETGNINFLLRLPIPKNKLIKEKVLAHLLNLIFSFAATCVLILIFSNWLDFYISPESKDPLNILTCLIQIPFAYILGAFVSTLFRNFFTVFLMGILVYGAVFSLLFSITHHFFKVPSSNHFLYLFDLLTILFGIGFFFGFKKLLSLKETK